MKMCCLKHTKIFLITCLTIMVILGYCPSRQAEAANRNEEKVAGPGGYAHLRSISQEKGSVRIIVQVRVPFTAESLLQEKDMHEQRSVTRGIQEKVITELEGKGHKPRRAYKYKYTPYIAMTVDSEAFDALLSSPDVLSVEKDILIPLALDQSVPRIGASQLHASNITGAGIAVAILDTGVDKNHPFLLGSIISEACYSSNDGGSSSLCPGGVEGTEDPGSAMPYAGTCPPGECDHGTHVAGIAAGRSGIVGSPGPGVAPGASIIAIQIFSRFNSYEDCGDTPPCIMSWSSDELNGLERVYELRNTYSIASVNMSLGGGLYGTYCDSVSPAMKSSIDNLRAAGIATVIASGNSYSCGNISFPACISTAISVGATDETDAVASYSNSATFLSLLAPGSSILSSVPGNVYQSWSGTSMATPHIAGSWALMKQAYPGATVAEILNSFTSTGLGVTDQGCTSVTKKRINVHEAYDLMSDYASLTIAKTGVGTGTVTSNPSGIACGQDCGELFLKDTSVTLNVIADPGSVFGGWSGGGCSGNDACVVSLSASSSVTALFRKQVTIGTQITIKGSDFGDKKGKVLIGDVAAKIAKDAWAHDTIACTVNKIPDGPPGIFDLIIIPKGADSILIQDTIDVKDPEISDYHEVAGGSIFINGWFFGTKKPKVYLEYPSEDGGTKKKKCKVASWFMNTTTGESNLVFVVPKGLDPGSYTLRVSNKVGTSVPMLFTIN